MQLSGSVIKIEDMLFLSDHLGHKVNNKEQATKFNLALEKIIIVSENKIYRHYFVIKILHKFLRWNKSKI